MREISIYRNIASALSPKYQRHLYESRECSKDGVAVNFLLYFTLPLKKCIQEHKEIEPMMNSYLLLFHFSIILYTLQFLSYLYLSLFAISFCTLAFDHR